MAQNFIPETSTIIHSITKRISEIYRLKRELMALLSPFKVSKFNHIFLHSLVSESDKNVPLTFFHFHMK